MPRGRKYLVGGSVFLAAVLGASGTPWQLSVRAQSPESLELLPLPDGGGQPTPADRGAIVGGQPQAEEGVEVLTRGPVHEAYAEPLVGNVESGPVLAKMPPDPVAEIPPEVRPEGDNVIWVPGYWAWDEEGDRFLWVSGIWRDTPPGRRWVPGYWTEVEGGASWVSGFWGAIEAEQVEYLAPPPASLDLGPPANIVNNNQFWVPGVWVYQQSNYAWRPGYWQDYRENWIWVPAHYVWTPAGCVYVAGYWDYRLPYRGQLFAPAVITHYAYSQPGFCYRPYYTINSASLMLHLFIAPHHRHYYFGNYYGPTYVARHYYPFCEYRRVGFGYDPLFTYYHAHFRRQGVDYGRRLNDWHAYFERNQDLRPPVTMHDHMEFAHRHQGHKNASQLILARTLAEERTRPTDGRRYVSADNSREVLEKHADELRRLTQIRHEQEHGLAVENPVDGNPADRRRKGPSRWNLTPDLVNNSGKSPGGRPPGVPSDNDVVNTDNGTDNGPAAGNESTGGDNPSSSRGPKFPGRWGKKGAAGAPTGADVAGNGTTPTEPNANNGSDNGLNVGNDGVNGLGKDPVQDPRRPPGGRGNRGPRRNDPVVTTPPGGAGTDGTTGPTIGSEIPGNNPNNGTPIVGNDGLPTNDRVIRGQGRNGGNAVFGDGSVSPNPADTNRAGGRRSRAVLKPQGNGNSVIVPNDGAPVITSPGFTPPLGATDGSSGNSGRSRRTPITPQFNDNNPAGNPSRMVPTTPPGSRRVPRSAAPTQGPITIGPSGPSQGPGNGGAVINQNPPTNFDAPRGSSRVPRSAPRNFEPTTMSDGLSPSPSSGRRSLPQSAPSVRSFSPGGDSGSIDSGSRRAPRMSVPGGDGGRPPRGAGGGGESGRARRGGKD